MRRSFYCFVVGAMLLASTGASRPAAAFEGTIKWRTSAGLIQKLEPLGAKADDPKSVLAIPYEKILATDGFRSTESVLTVKGNQVRESSPGTGSSYILLDTSSQIIRMISPEAKTVMEWTKADRDQLAERARESEKQQQEKIATLAGEAREAAQKQFEAQQAALADSPTVASTGKHEKISDLDTEVFDLSGKGVAARGWVAKQPADLAELFQKIYATRDSMQTRTGPGARDHRSIFSDKGIPVRVISVHAHAVRIDELVALEPGTVDAAALAVPTDYRKTTFDEFLKESLKKRIGRELEKKLPQQPPQP